MHALIANLKHKNARCFRYKHDAVTGLPFLIGINWERVKLRKGRRLPGLFALLHERLLGNHASFENNQKRPYAYKVYSLEINRVNSRNV